MNELLFENKLEKEALENILALNQIKKCDAEIDKYTKEIKEQNDTMISILKDEEVDEEYINKIHKYKNLLNKMDGDNGRVNELNKLILENESRINEFQSKISEIEEKLEDLKNQIFETNDPSKVIECQNEIENNNVRINDLNEILNQLISDNTPLLIEKEYLTAKNSDLEFNVPNCNKKEINKDLDKIISEFNNAISKLDLPIRENIEFCQKKIKNRENEIEKFNARKNEVIENYPNSIKLNIDSAYKELSNLLTELDLGRNKTDISTTNIFDNEIEKEQNEKEEVKPVEVKDTTDKSLKDEMSFIEETNIENDVEEQVPEEKKEIIKDEPLEIAPERTEEVSTDIEDSSNKETLIDENNIAELENASIDDNSNEKPEIEESSNLEESVETSEKDENKEKPIDDESEEIASVSYVLSDGESLMNIAEKVYPSKDNWQAIYYFNKETIDQYLVSNGISNDFDTIKELANDSSLFTGIKLEIPTDYNYKK